MLRKRLSIFARTTQQIRYASQQFSDEFLKKHIWLSTSKNEKSLGSLRYKTSVDDIVMVRAIGVVVGKIRHSRFFRIFFRPSKDDIESYKEQSREKAEMELRRLCASMGYNYVYNIEEYVQQSDENQYITVMRGMAAVYIPEDENISVEISANENLPNHFDKVQT
jgi:uridine kinase